MKLPRKSQRYKRSLTSRELAYDKLRMLGYAANSGQATIHEIVGNVVRQSGCTHYTPIFIVGAPRSGTSFIGSIFGGTKGCAYFHEPPITKKWSRTWVTGEDAAAHPFEIFLWTHRLLRSVSQRGHSMLVDKTPQHSFIVPELKTAFPNAKFIHIYRDGRDVACSYREKPWIAQMSAYTGRYEDGGYRVGPTWRHWVEPHRRKEWESASDTHRAIWAWRLHVEASVSSLENIASSDRLVVRYENLAEHEFLSDTIGNFVGASPGDREVIAQGLKGFTPNSVGVWRRVLSDLDLQTIEYEAGKTLESLGYHSK